MRLLKTGNSKLKKDGIYTWSLPAVKSCPQAGLCAVGCYATQGFFNMPSVKKSYAANFELAKKPVRFFKEMRASIEKQNPKVVRIHASGDFFNEVYFAMWVALAKTFPQVKFYAYTKMVKMVKTFKQVQVVQGEPFPKNFTIIYSEGGKQDALIQPGDRHSRVFSSLKELKAAGYIDTTKNDLNAIGKNKKIGLVYHGAKSKTWSSVGGKK